MAALGAISALAGRADQGLQLCEGILAVDDELNDWLRGQEGLVLCLVLGSGVRMEGSVVLDLVDEQQVELGGREAGNALNFGDADEVRRAVSDAVRVQVCDRLQRSH